MRLKSKGHQITKVEIFPHFLKVGFYPSAFLFLEKSGNTEQYKKKLQCEPITHTKQNIFPGIFK